MAEKWKRFGQRVQHLGQGVKTFRTQARRVRRPFHRWFSRPLPKLRLSHQLLGFFVIVVLFPLLLLSFSIYGINSKAVRKQVRHFTEHTASATYEELRLEMAWQKQQAQLAAAYWQSLRDRSQTAGHAERVQQFFTDYPDFEAVAFYDLQGQRVALHPSPHPLYREPQLPLAIRQPLQRPRFELHYHRSVTKAPELRYSLEILVPVRDPQGKIGTIAFFKRFPYLWELIKERYETFGNGFVIVDHTGTIMAGPANLISHKLPKPDLHLYYNLPAGVVKEFSARKPTYSFTATTPDEEEPGLEKVFIKVPDLGWGLIIESPYHIQTRYIQRARAQSVGLVFLCILLIVLLGLLYSRGINRNFRQLIKGIKALAEGRYSRKIRLITKSWTPYEIVYLTAEFNRMATKISSAWASIQKLNQELVYKNQQDVFITQATQRLHSSLELEAVCQTATQIFSERQGIIGALLYLQTESGQFEPVAQNTQPLLCALEDSLVPAANDTLFTLALKGQTPVNAGPSKLPFLPQETLATVQPILYQSHPLGVLVLIKPQTRREETYDDGLMVDLISSQIGVAIHQARQWKQLQKANEQLSKLDELKSNLIDTVSHELRTPLTNIKGYTSRLIRYENTLDSPTKIKSLKVIKQQADRLTRLVEDLLVIPDLERQGGIRVFPDRVNLGELLHRCVGFVEEKANRDIRMVPPAEGVNILVDPDRMEQVLLNLLDNAIKYSLEDSAIEVSAHQTSASTARIEVFNRCEPIPPEELATLFTKFKRLDERLTRTTRGTGLGLFITRGLVEAMGGRIWLDNTEGFRVLVEVPLFEGQSGHTNALQDDSIVTV